MNARKAPIGVRQLGIFAAAGGGLIGFRLIDGAKVVSQINAADRQNNSQHDGQDRSLK